MEGVEGLMKGLKLSEAEKKGLKIGATAGGKELVGAESSPRAVGKLFSEKPAHASVIGHTLGRIWCPIKGVDCKELDENIFLFSFRQASGWRRALEEGPWWFDKELLVMEEYDPEKTTDEYEFRFIPIWVRVYGLPVGSMNREAGEKIGEDIGEVLEVDVGPDGTTAGNFLRIKVRLDIRKALMRFFLLDRGDKSGVKDMNMDEGVGGKQREMLWCRFEYEYLPDFCYTCGVIGHGEKECKLRVKKGEAPQFGPWLRVMEEGRRSGDGS
ncbi:hypothetical protein VPH35_127179 [Triticum aestivum]